MAEDSVAVEVEIEPDHGSVSAFLPKAGARYGMLTGATTAIGVNIAVGALLGFSNAFAEFDGDSPVELFYFFLVGGFTVGAFVGAVIGALLGFLFGVSGTIRHAPRVMALIWVVPLPILIIRSNFFSGVAFQLFQFRSLVFLALPISCLLIGYGSGRLFLESVRLNSLRDALRAALIRLGIGNLLGHAPIAKAFVGIIAILAATLFAAERVSDWLEARPLREALAGSIAEPHFGDVRDVPGCGGLTAALSIPEDPASATRDWQGLTRESVALADTAYLESQGWTIQRYISRRGEWNFLAERGVSVIRYEFGNYCYRPVENELRTYKAEFLREGHVPVDSFIE